jgi:hypothetical protein
MVTSRHRSSNASITATSTQDTSSPAQASEPPALPSSRVSKLPLDDWTTREKLCLASLAMRHNNSWSSVARQMQSFVEKDRPDGFLNQKSCAAQFDRLMNELGVDKRPKRNESTDSTGSVIYKKMTEKYIKELEDSIIDMRNLWLKLDNDLNEQEEEQPVVKETIKLEPPTSGKQRGRQSTQFNQSHNQQQGQHQHQPSIQSTNAKTSSKVNASATNESEKPPTRALTRRESSRQNLEKTFSVLYQEAMEIKALNQLCRPSPEVEKQLGSYDKVVFQHVDMSTIKKKFSGDIDDPYALMNDFLLMFQNATTYYPTDHPTYKIAVELREKLVPQWERQTVERHRSRH